MPSTSYYEKGFEAMKKEVKTNVMRILEKEKVDYQAHFYEHGKDAVDGVTVAALTGQNVDQVFKTLVTVSNKKEYFVFVIPVAHELDLKKAAKSVGAKSVSMIPVKDITAVTGYIRGGCTAIGMKKQYITRIDSSAESLDKIYVSGGKRGSQILLSPQDLKRVARAEFGDVIVR